MVTQGERPKIDPFLPVLFLIVAATAIPIEMRSFSHGALDFSFNGIEDFVENVIGYIPLGIVLARFGPWKGIALAGLLSTLAEVAQFGMAHRDPAFADICANVLGAAFGAFYGERWKITRPSIRVGGRLGLLAAFIAIPVVFYWRDASSVNDRGSKVPGILEGDWSPKESAGRIVRDGSGHNLPGKFQREPSGAKSTGSVFDGKNYVDLGHPESLHLRGSMTITAWIDSTSYPRDDAAIVSELQTESGYQLDTTIDTGPRTTGFKIFDCGGALMARYGATPLFLHTAYHLAGVYDAAWQTMDVYLNGKLDNGQLIGSVSGAQRGDRGSVYLGRRASSLDFNFSGSIDRARIYSFALSKAQIEADMRGEAVLEPTSNFEQTTGCPARSYREDKDIPLEAGIVGVLAGIVSLGLWPSRTFPVLVLSLGAGLSLLEFLPPDLPVFTPWIVALTALAGGLAICGAVRR